MEIFNRYTMVYCAVFGHSFIASGRKAFDMFKASGALRMHAMHASVRVGSNPLQTKPNHH